MAKKRNGSAKIPKPLLYGGLVIGAAAIGFYIYRKKGVREAARARAWRRAMVARSPY